MMKKILVVAACLLLFTMVQPSVFAVESKPSPRFVLEDDYGGLYYLSIAKGVILYGEYEDIFGDFHPTYGFIFGNEMVLWINAPGAGTPMDSLAIVGDWDFGQMIFTGNLVSFYYPDLPIGSDVTIWPAGAAAGKETKNEPGSLIAQSGAASKPQGDGSADRGAYCFKDSSEYVWDLDLAFGAVYHGSVDVLDFVCPAYGFTFGDEMFLWANVPEDGDVDFVYTGMCDSRGQMYLGAWADGPPSNAYGLVSWWSC